jgi:very-short-patch-repair endonuclease
MTKISAVEYSKLRGKKQIPRSAKKATRSKEKQATRVLDNTKILRIIQELDKGNIIPAKNFLRTLLPEEFKSTNRTEESIKIANTFRKDAITNATKSEKLFRTILDELRIKYDFQRNIFYDYGKWFRVDFYIPIGKYIIEIDGGYHNSQEQIIKDSERAKILQNMDTKVIRFTNEEVINSPEFKKLIKLKLNIR